jgi:RNA polymerase sigma-70 factor (ECF subfamily)
VPQLKWPNTGQRASETTAPGRPTDDVSFDRLFDENWTSVFRYCFYRLGNWHAAEDAASQTFLNAYAAWNRFEQRGFSGATQAWLFKIAYRVVSNMHRERARHPQATLDSACEQMGWEISPEDAALAQEDHRTVRALLDVLKSDQREMMELRLAGLNDVEIAEVLGKSPAAVRKAQSRAVFAMRDQLGLTPTTQKGADRD